MQIIQPFNTTCGNLLIQRLAQGRGHEDIHHQGPGHKDAHPCRERGASHDVVRGFTLAEGGERVQHGAIFYGTYLYT